MQHLAAASMLESSNGSRNPVRAANLLGYVDGRLESLEVTREHTELQGYTELLSALWDGSTEKEALAQYETTGKAWNEERAVAEARTV
jgi:hypothetical protein